jgi:REP element-mobilizing transposase RayT
MPNHLHGILILREETDKGDECVQGLRRRSIGAIVGSFKSAVTKRINEMRATPDEAVWQRNFYDYLIRDQDDLQRVRRYIESNPIRWAAKYNASQREGDAGVQGEACLAATNVSSRTNTPAHRRE